jgi:hypothetical protein
MSTLIFGGISSLYFSLCNEANQTRNFGILIIFVLFFAFVYLVAAEKLLFEISKGEVLIFRRGHRFVPKSKSAPDPESQNKQMNYILPTTASRVDSSCGETLGIQRQTAVFHWKDLCYQVSIKGKPRVILDRVNGWVKPGTLTALMVSPQTQSP